MRCNLSESPYFWWCTEATKETVGVDVEEWNKEIIQHNK